MQVLDPHNHQYMERMKDEPLFLALASKASDHVESRRDFKSQAKIALRRVEHFYYKSKAVYEQIGSTKILVLVYKVGMT